MRVRIALQCTEADSRLILAQDNGAARLLSRPGDAIYNDQLGLVEGNQRFQVAWLPDDERDAYLRALRNRDDKSPRPNVPRQVVFEGNALARIEDSETFSNQLTLGPGPISATVDAWLGDPIAVRESPTAAILRRQSSSNLLIVGQDVESATGALAAAFYSLALQHGAGVADFVVFDFTPIETPSETLWDHIAEKISGAFQLV